MSDVLAPQYRPWELGAKLFTRLPRGVELTPAGEGFLEEARAVWSGVERATVRARAAAMGQRGRISIGLTTSASLHPEVTRMSRAYIPSPAPRLAVSRSTQPLVNVYW